MTQAKVSLRILVILIIVATSVYHSFAQSAPAIPTELTVAGVPIYLSEAARARLQQEVRQLYANRPMLEQELTTLRQLTPLWQPTLQATRLPLDFRYLALPALGSDTPGYWSVKPQQVDPIGLRIDGSVDERLHPLVSAEKVLTYIGRLRETYRENAMRTMLRYLRADVLQPITPPAQNSVESVWLDTDSPARVWTILARKIVIEHEEPAYRPIQPHMLYAWQSSNGQSLSELARQLDLPDERFTPYNDWLKVSMVPIGYPAPILIQLLPDEFPAVRAADVNAAKPVANRVDMGFPILLKSSAHAEGLRTMAIFYTINQQRGIQAQTCDNFITLAFYGDISVKKFLTYNDLTERDVVRPGQIYYLEPKAKRAKIPFHVVERNQSLRDVAYMYGMRLSSLQKFNRIETTKRAGPGRVLWLQEKRPRNRPVEYQQLPPEPTPALPVPEPTLTSTDSTAVAKIADPTRELILAQSPTIQPETPAPQPVTLSNPVSIPTPATSPTEQVALEEKPVAPLAAEPLSVPAIAKSVTKPVLAAKVHVVKSGQTYYAISRLYGVTPAQLYIWNNLSEKVPLEVGQELLVSAVRKPAENRPVRVTVVTSPASSGIVNKFVVEPIGTVVYHIVKPGQTVYRVALINRTTVANVMKWNNLNDYRIRVGQKLIVSPPKQEMPNQN